MVPSDGSLSERSIRQGCPLAPLLRVIMADALGCLVADALSFEHLRANALLKGIHIILLLCIDLQQYQKAI